MLSSHMSKNDLEARPKMPKEPVNKITNFTLPYVFSKCIRRDRFLISFR